MTTALLIVGFIVAALIGLVVYFVPLAIAVSRGHPNVNAIAVLNVLLGWSFIGWVAALIWSLTAFEPDDDDA